MLLRAGPLTARLDRGTLRNITVDGCEVIRSIEVVVRDIAWGTVPGLLVHRFFEDRGHGFVINLAMEHLSDSVAFRWNGTLIGEEDGFIAFRMVGRALREFLRTRIGLVVLHPMELAGTAVEIETAEDSVLSAFPETIARETVFANIRRIRHTTKGSGSVEIAFRGEVFETEDQRNWTDATYKTYCPPLRPPHTPVTMVRGDVMAQEVVIVAKNSIESTVEAPAKKARAVHVAIGPRTQKTLPDIGLGSGNIPSRLSVGERAELAALNVAHLRVTVDLSESDWSEQLDLGVESALDLGCGLELEVLADPEEPALTDLVAKLKRPRVPIVRLMVFDRAGFVTSPMLAATVRALIRNADISIPLSGGSRSHFVHLNRLGKVPSELDEIAFSISPQVHASDDESIMDTLKVHPLTVSEAFAIGCGRPVVVGPIVLRPRFGPVATSRPGPPDATDPRQMEVFAAAWTIAALGRLAYSGASAVTFFDLVGPTGLVATLDSSALTRATGVVRFPAYEVFQILGQMKGWNLHEIRVTNGSMVEGLAAATSRSGRILLTNVGSEPVSAEVSTFAGSRIVGAPLLRNDHDQSTNVLSLTLPPRQVVSIDLALD